MNNKTEAITLSHDDIKGLLSDYLYQGRKQESWEIEQIQVEDKRLTAKVMMTSTYVSGTDQGGFHLTIFSTLEFLSQLMIIYAHVWAGFPEKTREGWMIESKTKSVRVIRNPENIQIEMDVTRMKQRGDNLYCIANYKVTDDQDGLFEVTLKGFLS